MLRGPEVSSQDGDGGLLQAHTAAWICMAPRYSWALSSADGAQQSSVPPAGRSVSLPQSGGGGGSARRGFVGMFAGRCHIQPVSTGPGETEIRTAELLLQREAITGAADVTSGVLVPQPPTDALRFSLCSQLQQQPCKVNPAFEEHLKTIWYYSQMLLI